MIKTLLKASFSIKFSKLSSDFFKSSNIGVRLFGERVLIHGYEASYCAYLGDMENMFIEVKEYFQQWQLDTNKQLLEKD